MTRRTQILLGIAVLLLQLFLSEFLAIRQIRPDFLLIFVLYVSILEGSLAGVIVGFVAGLLQDVLSAGSLLGLAPLTKSITGFLVGRLQGQFPRMNPIVFHVLWIGILLFHFAMALFVRLQTLFDTSPALFWKTWALTVLYTLVFIVILQLIVPLPRLAGSSTEERR
ncbi:MAG: rod shape-determining protein MreD [Fidelibacterota bacterium]